MPECKKRLDLTAFPCKCCKTFCPQHRGSYDHACTFDYKSENARNLKETMGAPVVGEKLQRV